MLAVCQCNFSDKWFLILRAAVCCCWVMSRPLALVPGAFSRQVPHRFHTHEPEHTPLKLRRNSLICTQRHKAQESSWLPSRLKVFSAGCFLSDSSLHGLPITNSNEDLNVSINYYKSDSSTEEQYGCKYSCAKPALHTLDVLARKQVWLLNKMDMLGLPR